MVGRARAIARGFELNTDGWPAVVRLSRDRRPETRLVESNANSNRSPLLRPSVAVEVFLVKPKPAEGARLRAHLHLSQDGRLLDWNIEGPADEDADRDGAEGSSHRTPTPAGAAVLAALVTQATQRLAGASAPLFHPMSSDPIKSDGAYELEAHDPSNSALNWRIHIGFVHGHLVKAELDPDVVDASFFSSFRWRLHNHRSAATWASPCS